MTYDNTESTKKVMIKYYWQVSKSEQGQKYAKDEVEGLTVNGLKTELIEGLAAWITTYQG